MDYITPFFFYSSEDWDGMESNLMPKIWCTMTHNASIFTSGDFGLFLLRLWPWNFHDFVPSALAVLLLPICCIGSSTSIFLVCDFHNDL